MQLNGSLPKGLPGDQLWQGNGKFGESQRVHEVGLAVTHSVRSVSDAEQGRSSQVTSRPKIGTYSPYLTHHRYNGLTELPCEFVKKAGKES